MLIDCETCAVRNVECAECVVPLLLDFAPPGMPPVVEMDTAERHAIEALAQVGLVPNLLHTPGSGHMPASFTA